MTDLIALKAQLGIALKRFMALSTAQNTSLLLSLIGTLSRHMTELFAPDALNRWVELHEVSVNLLLHLVKLVHPTFVITTRVFGSHHR